MRRGHALHERAHARAGVRPSALLADLWPVCHRNGLLRERRRHARAGPRASHVHATARRGRLSGARRGQDALHTRLQGAARVRVARHCRGRAWPAGGRLRHLAAPQWLQPHHRHQRHTRGDVLRAATRPDAGLGARQPLGGRPQHRLPAPARSLAPLLPVEQLHPPAPAVLATRAVEQAVPRPVHAAAQATRRRTQPVDVHQPRAEPL